MKLNPTKAKFQAINKLSLYYELCEEALQKTELGDEDRTFYLEEMHNVAMMWKERSEIIKRARKSMQRLSLLVTRESRGRDTDEVAYRYFSEDNPLLYKHRTYFIDEIYISNANETTKRKVMIVYSDGSIEEKTIGDKNVYEIKEYKEFKLEAKK